MALLALLVCLELGSNCGQLKGPWSILELQRSFPEREPNRKHESMMHTAALLGTGSARVCLSKANNYRAADSIPGH